MSRYIKLFSFLIAACLSISCFAQTSTKTLLAIVAAGKSASSVPSGTAVTLMATVSAGAAAVHPGTVNFCDTTINGSCTGVAILGTAQLTSNGTASVKLRLGIGSHSLQAYFVGTGLYAASSSAVSTLSVTGTPPYSTTTTLSSAPGANAQSYDLTAIVSRTTPLSLAAPTGTVDFVNSGNSSVLTSASLTTGTSGSLASLGPEQNYSIGSGPSYSIATGDFNDDGILDIAALGDATTISVLLGKGDGSFAAPTTYPAGSSPVYIATGDFNGDGQMDLVVTVDEAISVLLGNGDGTFQAPQTFALPDSAYVAPASALLAVADLDGDGNLDVVVGIGTLSEFPPCQACGVSVLLGNGDGTFKTQLFTSLASEPSSVAVADFNGDGIPDLAFSLSTGVATGEMQILLGKGDGTFRALQTFGVSGTNYLSVTADDFNGDGKADLAIIATVPLGASAASIMLGNGDGTFQTPQSYASSLSPDFLIAGDFNGDGKLDLATVASANFGLTVLLVGNGDGTFLVSPQTSPLRSFLNALTVGDFDGDGKLDLVISDQVETAGIFLNTSTLTTTVTATGISVPGSGTQMLVAEYSGDASFRGSTSNTISVNGSSVPITWAAPTSITYGTALSTTQLDASSTVPSTFVYTPPSGTILGGGTQTLSVTATPNGSTGYIASTDTVSITVNPAATATSVALSDSNKALTGSVSSAVAGMPTGTVSFYEGQTLLGSGTLVSGVASYTPASPPAGTAVITAQYGGDTNFGSSGSSPVTLLAIVPVTTSLTVGQTGSTTDSLSVAPVAGYSGTLQLSCKNLPQASTCSFQPSTLSFSGTNASASVILTVQTGVTATARFAPSNWVMQTIYAATTLSIPGWFVATILRKRRNLSDLLRLLIVVGLLGGLTGLFGCGGGSSSTSSNSGTPPGSTTIQVVATDSANFSQTVSITLIVQ